MVVRCRIGCGAVGEAWRSGVMEEDSLRIMGVVNHSTRIVRLGGRQIALE